MLKIYHVTGTRSIRPIWLCYELGLPVEIETIDFSESFRDSPPWRRISPAGKVPVMTDGDLILFESGAMVDVILERYGEGRLCPDPGAAQSALYRQWCWFAEATLLRPLGFARILRMKSDGAEVLVQEGIQKARDCLATVDQALLGRDFLLGPDFSAADIMMGCSLELLRHVGLVDDAYPNALAYLGRLKDRDACQRAMSA